jgi:5-methylcytosine-specific restriction enzyme subunit McrC
VAMFDANRRRPLRAYRRDEWRDFFIDGEANEEDLILPHADGFTQTGLVLDNQNEFNRCIRDAMRLVLPEIRDGDLRRVVATRILALSPQSRKRQCTSPRIPARHQRWGDLYELSRLVETGFGVRYDKEGQRVLPGFLLRTADAWEHLLRFGLSIGLKDHRVRKDVHYFGEQHRVGAKNARLHVEPDLSLYAAGKCVLIADAKYKGRGMVGPAPMSINRGDIYETLAFLKATGCRRALLLYPALQQLSTPCKPGTCAAFERLRIHECDIIGIAVDVRGLSRHGGLLEFGSGISAEVAAWC